jgi:LPS sulfotransferase NodH
LAASAYIVAAIPRTGSSLLCEGLTATSIAGYPAEPFAPAFRWMWRERWGLGESVGINEYVRTALSRGTSPNGVTAFKIQWMHVGPLALELGCAADDVLASLLPEAKFIQTVRRDRRAQALSWFRAIATSQWWRLDDAPQARPPRLDPAAVRDLESHIEDQENGWRDYFARRDITPLTIEYEALEKDYRGVIGGVLEFLGFDTAFGAAIPEPRLSRQADAVTAQWRRQLTNPGIGDG